MAKKRFKAKFKYTYGDGYQQLDKNRYKTLKAAQSYARAVNRNTKRKADKIVAVHKR